MSKQIEQIRAEIERLIKNPRLDKEYNPAYKAGLRDLRKFIDALPKEDVPADVQEAAEKYGAEQTPVEYPNLYGEDAIKSAYAAGMLAERDKPIPEDVKKAADQYIGHPREVDEDSATFGKRLAYSFGMITERWRLMKEAPVADVIEMRGSTENGYPLELTLGFLRWPNIKFNGGAVRVIIEEIKEE